MALVLKFPNNWRTILFHRPKITFCSPQIQMCQLPKLRPLPALRGSPIASWAWYGDHPSFLFSTQMIQDLENGKHMTWPIHYDHRDMVITIPFHNPDDTSRFWKKVKLMTWYEDHHSHLQPRWHTNVLQNVNFRYGSQVLVLILHTSSLAFTGNQSSLPRSRSSIVVVAIVILKTAFACLPKAFCPDTHQLQIRCRLFERCSHSSPTVPKPGNALPATNSPNEVS